ncbi:alpha/beta hydrolase family protein [Polaromonas sp. CT11-55]|uniref:alpha/beta hydrolase family protein n=1 Tax=Polaromonas sp. CT11-55 TaxID=3243045 RepID=UPI0039A686CA
MHRYFLSGLLLPLLLTTASAQAGMGFTQVPGLQDDSAISVFYPSAGEDRPMQVGAYSLKVDKDGQPVRGNTRLVVISHGSGGSPWTYTDLARRLVEDGFVVAFPLHRGDNARDPSSPGPDSWKQRPAEVSRAIDALAREPRFAPLLSLDKVGMYGMSAGGHTALTLAGGRWSPALLTRHCEAHIAEDFQTCAGLTTRLTGGMLDGLKKTVVLAVIRQRFSDATWQSHHDARIQAVVAGVPLAADFDMASLASPAVPLGLVTARQDRWLVPRFHGDVVLAACQPRCELLADLPDGGHGALLSPPPPADGMSDLAKDLLLDPPGFDRSQLPALDRKISTFLRKHLLP